MGQLADRVEARLNDLAAAKGAVTKGAQAQLIALAQEEAALVAILKFITPELEDGLVALQRLGLLRNL